MKKLLYISLAFNLFVAAAFVAVTIRTGYYKHLAFKLGFSDVEPYNVKAGECLKGWTNSLYSLRDTVDVVFIGNSITYGGDFSDYFSDRKICNLGYPSDDIEGMMSRIDQLKVLQPSKIFVMIGFNGLAKMSDIEFDEQYSKLIEAVTKALPKSQIYLQSLLPVNNEISNLPIDNERIAKANKRISSIAEKHNLPYVDLYRIYVRDGVLDAKFTKDGVHLKGDAYSLWVKAISSYVYDN